MDFHKLFAVFDGLAIIVWDAFPTPSNPLVAHEMPAELAELQHGVKLEGLSEIHVQLALIALEEPRCICIEALRPLRRRRRRRR